MNLFRKPLLELFVTLITLRARGGFGYRNEHFGELDGVANECHAIECRKASADANPARLLPSSNACAWEMPTASKTA